MNVVIALIVLLATIDIVVLWLTGREARASVKRFERKKDRHGQKEEQTEEPARKDLERLAVERLEEANFWAYDGREQLPISNDDIQNEIAKIRSEKGNRLLRLE